MSYFVKYDLKDKTKSRAQQVLPPKKAQQVPPAASPPRILKLHV